MTAGEVLYENVTSLFNEHDDKLRDPKDPDAPDIAELIDGLSLSLAAITAIPQRALVELVVIYIRSAYGVGLHRGQAHENRD